MNIKDIYMGASYTFKVLPTMVNEVVRLEPNNSRVSLFYKKGEKYEDLLTGKILESPNCRIVKTCIFANTNEVEENKDYVLPEYLSSFKEYVKLVKLGVKNDVTKKELFEIVKCDEFLLNCLKEEVRNEKSI